MIQPFHSSERFAISLLAICAISFGNLKCHGDDFDQLMHRGAQLRMNGKKVTEINWSGASKRNPDGPKITDDDLKLLAGLADLEVLIVSSEHISDAAVAHLAGLKNLKVLEISGGRFTDAWGDAIAGKLPNLEQLRFSGPFSTTGQAYKYAQTFPRLKYLNLHHHTKTLGDAALEQLAEVKTLEKLVMGGNAAATGPGFGHVAKMSNLKVLVMNHCFGLNSDQALSHLKDMRNLEDLNVSMITDAGLSHLGNVKSLRKLRIGSPCIVTAEGLEHLSNAPNLEELSIYAGTVSDDDLAPLLRMSELKKLSLAGTRVTARGEARLKDALPDTAITRTEKYIGKYDADYFWNNTVSRFKRIPELDAVRKAYEQRRNR
jgi:Leucine-rich repeat (LRR) protein